MKQQLFIPNQEPLVEHFEGLRDGIKEGIIERTTDFYYDGIVPIIGKDFTFSDPGTGESFHVGFGVAYLSGKRIAIEVNTTYDIKNLTRKFLGKLYPASTGNQFIPLADKTVDKWNYVWIKYLEVYDINDRPILDPVSGEQYLPKKYDGYWIIVTTDPAKIEDAILLGKVRRDVVGRLRFDYLERTYIILRPALKILGLEEHLGFAHTKGIINSPLEPVLVEEIFVDRDERIPATSEFFKIAISPENPKVGLFYDFPTCDLSSFKFILKKIVPGLGLDVSVFRVVDSDPTGTAKFFSTIPDEKIKSIFDWTYTQDASLPKIIADKYIIILSLKPDDIIGRYELGAITGEHLSGAKSASFNPATGKWSIDTVQKTWFIKIFSGTKIPYFRTAFFVNIDHSTSPDSLRIHTPSGSYALIKDKIIDTVIGSKIISGDFLIKKEIKKEVETKLVLTPGGTFDIRIIPDEPLPKDDLVIATVTWKGFTFGTILEPAGKTFWGDTFYGLKDERLFGSISSKDIQPFIDKDLAFTDFVGEKYAHETPRLHFCLDRDWKYALLGGGRIWLGETVAIKDWIFELERLHPTDPPARFVFRHLDPSFTPIGRELILDRDPTGGFLRMILDGDFIVKGKFEKEYEEVSHIGSIFTGDFDATGDIKLGSGPPFKTVLFRTPIINFGDGFKYLQFETNLLYLNKEVKRIGINTIEPLRTLHVVGSELITGDLEVKGFTGIDENLFVAKHGNIGGNLLVSEKVGIGTTTPGPKLDVVGSARISGDLSLGLIDDKIVTTTISFTTTLSLAINRGRIIAEVDGKGVVFISVVAFGTHWFDGKYYIFTPSSLDTAHHNQWRRVIPFTNQEYAGNDFELEVFRIEPYSWSSKYKLRIRISAPILAGSGIPTFWINIKAVNTKIIKEIGTDEVVTPPVGDFIEDTISHRAGNVGIGTPLPTEKLDVAGEVLFKFAPDSKLKLKSTGVGGKEWHLISGGTGGALPAGNFGILIPPYSFERSLVINAAGDVGIGTFYPQTKFHVIRNTGTSIAKHEIARFYNVGSTASTGIFFYGHGQGAVANWINTQGDEDLRLGSGSFDEAITIEGSTGNVGIGKIAPLTKLDVNGFIRFYLKSIFIQKWQVQRFSNKTVKGENLTTDGSFSSFLITPISNFYVLRCSVAFQALVERSFELSVSHAKKIIIQLQEWDFEQGNWSDPIVFDNPGVAHYERLVTIHAGKIYRYTFSVINDNGGDCFIFLNGFLTENEIPFLDLEELP